MVETLSDNLSQEEPILQEKQQNTPSSNFFSIGVPKHQKLTARTCPEKWKDIRPSQQYDAVNKQAFRLKLAEQKRASATKDSMAPNKNNFKKMFKTQDQLEQYREKSRVIKFLQKIENLIGRESFIKFKNHLTVYKTNANTTIDQCCEGLFLAFFGSEKAVCSMEVRNYSYRKQILKTLGQDQIQPRHKERYNDLIELHFKACEAKPRTKPVNLGKGLVADSATTCKEHDHQDDGSAEAEAAVERLCMVCYKSENLYAAKCTHLACLDCWTTWLEKMLECPQCRARTRRNQLQPI